MSNNKKSIAERNALTVGELLGLKHQEVQNQSFEESVKRPKAMVPLAVVQLYDCTYGDTPGMIHCPLDKPCLTHQLENMHNAIMNIDFWLDEWGVGYCAVPPSGATAMEVAEATKDMHTHFLIKMAEFRAKERKNK